MLNMGENTYNVQLILLFDKIWLSEKIFFKITVSFVSQVHCSSRVTMGENNWIFQELVTH